MEKRKPLYIPIKTLDSEDYVTGFGKMELAIIVLTVSIAFIIGFIITMLVNSLVGIIIGCFVVAAVFVLVRRDSYNENMITKVKIIIQYNQSQKKYLYSYETAFDYTEEDV